MKEIFSFIERDGQAAFLIGVGFLCALFLVCSTIVYVADYVFRGKAK